MPLAELQALTPTQPILTLGQVLDQFYGKILLNIELKSRGSGEKTIQLLKKRLNRQNSCKKHPIHIC